MRTRDPAWLRTRRVAVSAKMKPSCEDGRHLAKLGPSILPTGGASTPLADRLAHLHGARAPARAQYVVWDVPQVGRALSALVQSLLTPRAEGRVSSADYGSSWWAACHCSRSDCGSATKRTVAAVLLRRCGGAARVRGRSGTRPTSSFTETLDGTCRVVWLKEPRSSDVPTTQQADHAGYPRPARVARRPWVAFASQRLASRTIEGEKRLRWTRDLRRW